MGTYYKFKVAVKKLAKNFYKEVQKEFYTNSAVRAEHEKDVVEAFTEGAATVVDADLFLLLEMIASLSIDGSQDGVPLVGINGKYIYRKHVLIARNFLEKYK